MEMRLKTRFMKKVVSKYIEKTLYKTKKVKMKIDIREFEVFTDETGKLALNVNAGATMEQKDYEKLMGIVLDEEDED